MRYNFCDLIEKIERIEKRMDAHEEIESKLLDLLNYKRTAPFYSKEITISDAIRLIPFDIFDLSINGSLVCRGVTRKDLVKRWSNMVYGINSTTKITDVRISLRESLVDIVTYEL